MKIEKARKINRENGCKMVQEAQTQIEEEGAWGTVRSVDFTPDGKIVHNRIQTTWWDATQPPGTGN